MKRREFLLGAAAAAAGLVLLPRRALALGELSQFRFAQLQHGGRWDPRPTGLKRLAWEIEKRTSVELSLDPKPVTLSDPGLFRTPFLTLQSDGAFPLPSEAELTRLRRFLTSGGSCSRTRPTASTRSIVRSARSPRRSSRSGPSRACRRARPLPQLLPRGPRGGRLVQRPYLEAVVVDNRIVMLVSMNDMAGAWARDSFGNWEFDVSPGGNTQREMTFRLGVNIVLYALCLDYKDDQVHLPFLMKRRK